MYQIAGVTHRKDYIPYLIQLPKEDIAPCDHPETHEVLRMLSCAARQAKLYLVINLCEKVLCTVRQPGCPSDGLMLYNTNIVFDRDGKIISRSGRWLSCMDW